MDDAVGLVRQVGLGCHDRQLQLNEPDDDTVRRFVEATKPVHGSAPISIAGPHDRRSHQIRIFAPRTARF
jgi:hypothetical protein